MHYIDKELRVLQSLGNDVSYLLTGYYNNTTSLSVWCRDEERRDAARRDAASRRDAARRDAARREL